MAGSHPLSLSSLPCGARPEMDFLDSSYFQSQRTKRCLPTPAEVRALSKLGSSNTQPPPVKFEDLALIVKFGPHVAVEEALCLWALKRVSCDIPVPEVYGWRVYGQEVFIYMELLPGVPLSERWNSLCEDDRTFVCSQLHKIIISLRSLEHEADDAFVGSINRGPLKDIIFEKQPMAGPFSTVRNFNDWFSQLPQNWLSTSLRYSDPYRGLLPDDSTIRFTHGDLHQANILIASSGPPQIVGVVDWAHAGWYPDYWEYCKAAFTSSYIGEWRNRWIPEFLSPRLQEHEAFGEYVMAMGSV